MVLSLQLQTLFHVCATEKRCDISMGETGPTTSAEKKLQLRESLESGVTDSRA